MMLKTMMAGAVALSAAVLSACTASTGATAGGSMFTGGNIPDIARRLAPEGCGGASPVGSLSLTATAVCRGVDLVAIGSNFSTLSNFDYSETDQFDLQLNASLKGTSGAVTSVVAPGELTLSQLEAASQPAPDSPRLAFWLAKVRATGGENLICETTPAEEENVILWILADMATDWLTDWLTYRPAQDYHAKVFVTPLDGGDYQVDRVEFVKRASEATPTCPMAGGTA